jgi:hypothetical protein
MPVGIYTLTLKACVDDGTFVLGADGSSVILSQEAENDKSQQWAIDTIFDPDQGLFGVTITNQESGMAIQCPDKTGEQLQLAFYNEDAAFIWDLAPHDNWWVISLSTNSGWSIDSDGGDGCRDGAKIQAYKTNKNDQQCWDFEVVDPTKHGA